MAADIEAVASWQSKQVISWFKGLDDGLQCYIPNLEEASITGAQLLALNYGDLNNLGVQPIGHQELVLEATDLLKQLHFELDSENLQSRALDLNCRCRTLRSSITSRRLNDTDAAAALQRGSSISLLRLSCDVLDSAKLLIMWLDRPPFFSNAEAREVRSHIVKLSHELSTTVQQSVFACVIEDAVTSICSEAETLSNQLIVSNDPMTIQPSSLEVAHLVNRDPLTGLGLFIKTTFEGHHVITGTKEGSISSKIRRITPGDEVVAIGGQTVVGWQLPKLVAALKESPNDVSITLKKRPHYSTTSSSATPTTRRQHQERVLTVPPPISPIRKVADSRKNSLDTLDGGISTSDISRHPSQDNVFSPKKSAGKKKKKLKKQKAKSSSNILATAAESSKKSSNRSSVNSFGSSIEESLRSASSSEAMLSISTGNLTKNFDLRKSLEKALRKEQRSSTELLADDLKQKKNSQSREHSKQQRKGKSQLKKPQQEMMPNVNDILEELRSKRMKKQENSGIKTPEKMDNNPSENQQNAEESTAAEPPSSPLDFLTIPPPPDDPYTPRTDNVLQVLTDESSLPSNENPTHSASESPNSLLDTEHRRRFTIIGSEQMDDKWFNSLLSEVNAKRYQRAKKASARQVLERLDETTVSEDRVFASPNLLAITETAPKMRPPKPKRRNRPVSMPPNYYSQSQLNQYRTPPKITNDGRSGSLLKIAQNGSSPVKMSGISPVAHQVDENGIKKLAPLNYSVENATSTGSSVKSNSLEYQRNLNRDSPVNVNNNISVERKSSTRSNYKTPPKPPRRSLSITERSTPLVVEKNNSSSMPVGRVKETGERLRLDLKPERPKSTSDDRYVSLLPVKPHGHLTPTEPLKEVKRQRSKTEIAEVPTPTRLMVADELSKYFMRKTGVKSMSSDQLSPASIPSPAWTESDPFSPKSQPSSARSPKKVALIPPVAKPRSRVTSPVVKNTPTPTPPKPDSSNSVPDGKKPRSKSVDSEEMLKTTSNNSQRHQSEGRIAPERSISKLSRTSTSRGSYVAAMDGAFSYDNILQHSEDDSLRRDSEGYAIKIVDGVKVRLRKNTSKSSNKKKGRLKIVDQLKSSPDMRSYRRISCRDLGAGECNGWLWKKKHNTSALSSKWSKRWVILKNGAIYCYRSEDDEKAESYISLPGYKVTPAPECKRKFAFRCAHPLRKTFYFASDRQLDMSRWMNKMGLAAIEYTQPSKDSRNGLNGEPKKEDDYYSESESEDSSFTQSDYNSSRSGTESSTPNSSPEKIYRPHGIPQYTTASSAQSTSRHMSTQPDLNRSARFPRNKAVTITQTKDAVTQSTQTNSPRGNDSRNRSKSEAITGTKGLLSSNSNITLKSSPVKKPAVLSEQRKHKSNAERRKQFLDTSHLSVSLEVVHPTTELRLRSSHSEEELRHLRNVAAKKAEEVAQREKRSSSSSLASSTSTENLHSANKKKKHAKGKKSPVVKEQKSETSEGSKSPSSQPRVNRRDVAGRPKLTKAGTEESTKGAVTDHEQGSIEDLSKGLHDAEVDIHGVNRRTTLRRKMTVLSRDPKRNDLMLKKRALQRQIKALEGELAYYNLLDEKAITSELLHKWINQHPSLVADLGTIRRMSKRRKTTDRDNNDNLTTVNESEHEGSSAEPESRGKLTMNTQTPEISFPVPAKRGLNSTPSNTTIEARLSIDSYHRRKHSDSDIPPTYSNVDKKDSLVVEGLPKVRPRSCAIAGYEVGKVKPLSPKTRSPTHAKNSLSPDRMAPNQRPYLETDL